MEYGRLGKSNLRVSRLALGTMNFGVRTDEAESFRIMDRARELGINFLDTANIYGITTGRPNGQGITEEIIGRWFAQGGRRRESTVLATKVAGSMDAAVFGPNDRRGYSGFKIRRQIDDSLRRLQTDYVELYQLHCWDGEASMDDVLDAFDVLSHQGKAYYLGTSNHAARQLAYWQASAVRKGVLGPVSEQHRYNLADRLAEVEVVPTAKELDLGLVVLAPLAAGLLSGTAHATVGGRREKAFSAMTEVQRTQLNAYHELCLDLGETEADVAVAWILANPNVTSVLLGPRTVEQLESSVRAADIVLDQGTLDRLNQIFPPIPGAERYAA